MNPGHSPPFTALSDLRLANHQVQVWQAWLDCSAQELIRYSALLSEDEQRRAGRFHFESDRNHYIVARGLLRLLLSAYLDIPPAQVEFCYGPQGKPGLPTQVGNHLEFNLSHSKGLGVFAFGRGNPIGIDVEYIRPMPDEDRFAEQFFSAAEIAWLAAHRGAEKVAGFFKIWTGKEAFFKASGDGLTLPISQAVIDLDGGPSVRLAAIAGDPAQAARWQIFSFEPVSGYQVALAAEGQDWQVTFGRLDLSGIASYLTKKARSPGP